MNVLSRMILLTVFLSLLASTVAYAERKTRWLGGGIIGGSVGLATGLAVDGFMYGISRATCETATCNYGSSAPYYYVPVITTAIGFGTGALIGMAFKRNNVEQTLQVAPMADPVTGTKGLMVQGSF